MAEKIPPVATSFGILSKRSNEILAQILERADQVLYMAKDAGRNQVQLQS